MVWAFVVSTGCLSYLSIFVFRMHKATDDGLLRIQNGYSYDSNDIGLVVLVGLVLTLLLIQTADKKGKTIGLWILFGIGVTIAKTGSRGAMIGMACVTVALLVMLRHVAITKRIGFVIVLGLGLVIAAPSGYWAQMATIFKPGDDYNYSSPTGRKAVLLRGIGYFINHPLTGLGVDNFPRAEGTISDRALAQAADPNLPGIKWSAPHNSFLQAGTEMGIPGLVLFSWLVFGGIFSTIKLRKKLPKEWSKGTQEERFLYFTSVYLPVAFIAFTSAGVFVSFAYMDLVYVLGALTAGLILCVEEKLAGAGGRVAAPVRPVRSGRGGRSARGAGPIVPPLPPLRQP
jgi:O-antigen ligase